MAKNEAVAGVWAALASAELYKRNQGKRLRRMSAGLIVGWVVFGCWTLSQGPLADFTRGVRVGIPALLAISISWLVFRLVNVPRVADFLIAVEAEMKKVSWPSVPECFRAGVVVISTMFLLSVALFAFDQLWIWFFKLIGVLRV